MPNQTSNYKLTKPLASELYDINVQNGNMDVIDETLKNIETEASRHPVANLLDNSDFRNPVNQRGNGSTIGDWKPCIDRWRATTVDAHPVWHDSDHIAIYQGCNIVQGIEAYKLKIGKEYTLACKIKDGEVCVVSGSVVSNDGYAMQYSANGVGMQLYGVNDGYWYVKVLGQKTNANVKLEWIALYEGVYTADTLPAYQPKGYAHELMECMRYYQRMPSPYKFYGFGESYGQITWDFILPVEMRVNPTVGYVLDEFWGNGNSYINHVNKRVETTATTKKVRFDVITLDGTLKDKPMLAVLSNITMSAEL